MTDRQTFINKLHELNYTFKKEKKRISIWRKRGGTHIVSLPHNMKLADEYVKSTLRQCGLNEAEILAFVTSAKS